MLSLRRLWFFLLVFVRSGHIGGSWVYAGIIAEKERKYKKHV